ncbi:retinaldehyde-binding protein 1-like [Chironomus tepperi]|uniref:retinaldehyde-binding protein 1-like n=1 Tax=Chironomus tepperi TaxID=113505 RepID=UPI00391FB9FC
MSIKFDNDKQPYIDLGQSYKICFDYKKIDDAKCLAKAREELRETPEIREQALTELRELIKGEKNLVFPTDDFFLDTYLRPCKFYAKSAFEKIVADSKFKIKYKKFYENIDLETTRELFEDNLYKYMPLNDKEGRRIVMIKCGEKWKLTRNNHKEFFAAMRIIFQTMAMEPSTQVNGVSMIIDMKTLDMSQVTALTPSFVSMLVKWNQDCIPIRFKRFFVVNNSKLINVFWALIAPFISKKYKDRFYIVNEKYEILADHMGKDCLDKDYEGNIPVDKVEGKVMLDYMKLFQKQFELLNVSGFVEENEDIEDKRNKVNALAKEILSTIKV